MKKLTGENLKEELWDTLLKLKSKKVSPTVANSVAAQSREILRIVSAELAVARANNEKPSRLILGSQESK